MNMSKELYLALFSMDAYNRGYNPKIEGLGGLNAHIGNALITHESDLEDGLPGVTHSFYAVAYEFNTENPNFVTVDDSGQTVGAAVISYRGTDQILPSFGEAWGDLAQGWTLGAGYPEAGSQGLYSLSFFNDVTERNPFDIGAGNGVFVTGHSLGGGLAGFVSLISGAKGIGYDHMPYGEAAVFELVYELQRRATAAGLSEVQLNTMPIPELFTQLGMHLPSYGDLSGIFVEGELNVGLRNGLYATGIGAYLASVLAGFGNWASGAVAYAFGQQIANGQVDAENHVVKVPLAVFGADLSTVELHSPSLLSILQYAKDNEITEWTSSELAPSALEALYDENLAKAAGAEAFPGEYATAGDLKAVMRTAIAYSAIDEGTRIFGDTGIRAMFDDLNQVGRQFGVNPSFFSKFGSQYFDLESDAGFFRRALVEAIVQFGGEMALRKVEQDTNAEVLTGIVQMYRDGEKLSAEDTGLPDLMFIDLSAERWDTGKTGGETHSPEMMMDWLTYTILAGLDPNGGGGDEFDIYFRDPDDGSLRNIDQLVDEEGNDIGQILTDFFSQAYGTGMDRTGWSDDRIVSNYITGVTLLLGSEEAGDDVTELAPQTSVENAGNLVLGSAGADNVLGTIGNEIILGRMGNDDIDGGQGDDILLGGSGADILDGGSDTLVGTQYGDYLNGGEGADKLIYRTGVDTLDGGLGDDIYDLTNASDNKAVLRLGTVDSEDTVLSFGHDALTDTGFGLEKVVFEGISSDDVELIWNYRSQTIGPTIYMMGDAVIRIISTGATLYIPSLAGQYASTWGVPDFPNIQSPFALEFTDKTETNWWRAFGLPWEITSQKIPKEYTGAAIEQNYEDERNAIDDTLTGSDDPDLPDDMVGGGAGGSGSSGGGASGTAEFFDAKAGNDTIRAGGGNDKIEGGLGRDIVDGGVGIDIASYAHATTGVAVGLDVPQGYSTHSVFLDITVPKEFYEGDAYGDTLISIEAIEGSAFNDTLWGGVIDVNLSGGDGDDLLIGTDLRGYTLIAKNVMTNDSLYGGAGADTLWGYEGADLLDGGTGNDVLAGGSGADNMFGGDGDDTVTIFETSQPGTPHDPGNIQDYAGGDWADGGVGVDLLQLAGASIVDMVSGGAMLRATGEFAGFVNFENVRGSAGNDVIYGDDHDNVLTGQAGDDVIFGGDGNDIIQGGFVPVYSPNGTVYAPGGHDTIYGGAGTDTAIIRADFADVTFEYMDGGILASFSPYYTGVPESVLISKDVEIIQLNDQSIDYATLLGQIQTSFNVIGDYVRLAEGTTSDIDVLGNDLPFEENALHITKVNGTAVTSGSVLRLPSGATVTVLADGHLQFDQAGAWAWLNERQSGTEMLTYTATDVTGVEKTVDLNVVIEGTRNAADSGSRAVLVTSDPLSSSVVRVSNFDIGHSVVVLDDGVIDPNAPPSGVTLQEIDGDTFILHGTDDAVILEDISLDAWKFIAAQRAVGNNGNDSIVGTVASEVLVGGGGNDTISGKGGDDVVLAGSGNDIVTTVGGWTTVLGEDGNDKITGGAGADALYGGAGADTLYGGRGNDTLSGGAGNDTIYAGAGHDQIDGGSGVDVLILEAADGENATVDLAAGKIIWGLFEQETITGIENVFGSIGNDTLVGNADNNTLSGGGGHNLIQGGAGNDVIYDNFNNNGYGVDGGDTLLGGDGHDYIESHGTGNTISGGAGNDTVIGDVVGNSFDGGDGSDILYMASGWYESVSSQVDLAAETLIANGETSHLGGFESIIGGAAEDTISGDDAGNYFDGGAGADRLIGLGGNDTLLGYTENDYLDGGDGNDHLEGHFGSDTLIGGAGADTLEGSWDNDIYYIDDVLDVALELAGGGWDIVHSSVNWTLGYEFDELHLSGSSGLSGTGNSGYNILYGSTGANLLTGLDGEDRLYGDAGNDTLVGGIKNDVLIGGAGDDVFRFVNGDERDRITDFAPGEDVIEINGVQITDLAALPSGVSGASLQGNYVLSYGSGNTVTIEGSPLLRAAYPSLFDVPGLPTDARAFSANGFDGVDIADITLSDEFTIEFWINYKPVGFFGNQDGPVSAGNGQASDLNFAGGGAVRRMRTRLRLPDPRFGQAVRRPRHAARAAARLAL